MVNRRVFFALLLTGLTAVLAAIPGPSRALADSGSADFNYLVASGFLCVPPSPSACPAVARAASGDTIKITGAGTLSIHTKSVSGGGFFTHKDPAGQVVATGVWTAAQLESFNSYGTSPGFPPTFEGGLVLIRVHLVSHTGEAANAILQVNCSIGKAPEGHSGDFVRLAVDGGPNFNEGVSGATLFVRLP